MQNKLNNRLKSWRREGDTSTNLPVKRSVYCSKKIPWVPDSIKVGLEGEILTRLVCQGLLSIKLENKLNYTLILQNNVK